MSSREIRIWVNRSLTLLTASAAPATVDVMVDKLEEHYSCDAADSIATKIKSNDLVILRSTVTVGTSRNVVLNRLEKFSGLKAGEDFSLAYAPERTIEGNAINEIQFYHLCCKIAIAKKLI